MPCPLKYPSVCCGCHQEDPWQRTFEQLSRLESKNLKNIYILIILKKNKTANQPKMVEELTTDNLLGLKLNSMAIHWSTQIAALLLLMQRWSKQFQSIVQLMGHIIYHVGGEWGKWNHTNNNNLCNCYLCPQSIMPIGSRMSQLSPLTWLDA